MTSDACVLCVARMRMMAASHVPGSHIQSIGKRRWVAIASQRMLSLAHTHHLQLWLSVAPWLSLAVSPWLSLAFHGSPCMALHGALARHGSRSGYPWLSCMAPPIAMLKLTRIRCNCNGSSLVIFCTSSLLPLNCCRLISTTHFVLVVSHWFSLRKCWKHKSRQTHLTLNPTP